MDEWVTNGEGNRLTRLLTHLQTMNWDDIAKKCNTTPGAASKRYSRMKQAFDSGAAAPTPAKKEVAEGGRKRKRAEGSKAKSKDKSEDKSEVDGDVDGQDADEAEGGEDEEEVVKNEKHEVKNEEKKEEKVKAETMAEVKEEKRPKPKPKVKEEEPVPISEKRKKEMFAPKRRALARIANLKNKVAVSLKEMHTEVMAGVSDASSTSASASASASEEEDDESGKEDGPQPPPAKKRALAPAAKTTTTEDNLAQKSDMSANKIIDIDGNEHEVLALAHSLPSAQLLAELEATVRKAAPDDAQAMLGEPADAQFYGNSTTKGQTENSNDELTQSRKYFLLNWVLRLIGY
jgi:hypothetical protein